MTAPCDCVASFPVSNEMVFSEPEIGADTRIASAMGTPFYVVVLSANKRRFPVVNPAANTYGWRGTLD
jgi:hypothetical protein